MIRSRRQRRTAGMMAIAAAGFIVAALVGNPCGKVCGLLSTSSAATVAAPHSTGCGMTAMRDEEPATLANAPQSLDPRWIAVVVPVVVAVRPVGQPAVSASPAVSHAPPLYLLHDQLLI